MDTTSVERIAEAVERELARVKAARPGLASRVERAGNIVVTHLSCRRQRVIRVRVRDGRPRFLVSGAGGAVYVVDPSEWSCTCPDHHRRGAGCKHSIAAWALWRASARPASVELPIEVQSVCDGCGESEASSGRLVEVGPVEAEHSLTAREGDALCGRCARRHGVV